MFPLLSLPAELQLAILQFTSVRDILRTRAVSSTLQTLIDDNQYCLAGQIHAREVLRLRHVKHHHNYGGLGVLDALQRWIAHKGLWPDQESLRALAWGFCEHYIYTGAHDRAKIGYLFQLVLRLLVLHLRRHTTYTHVCVSQRAGAAGDAALMAAVAAAKVPLTEEEIREVRKKGSRRGPDWTDAEQFAYYIDHHFVHMRPERRLDPQLIRSCHEAIMAEPPLLTTDVQTMGRSMKKHVSRLLLVCKLNSKDVSMPQLSFRSTALVAKTLAIPKLRRTRVFTYGAVDQWTLKKARLPWGEIEEMTPLIKACVVEGLFIH